MQPQRSTDSATVYQFDQGSHFMETVAVQILTVKAKQNKNFV